MIAMIEVNDSPVTYSPSYTNSILICKSGHCSLSCKAWSVNLSVGDYVKNLDPKVVYTISAVSTASLKEMIHGA